MADDITYNGWTNHATWAVHLHLSNDESLYREALARTTETIADPPRISEYWDEEQTRRYNVAAMLEEWVQDLCYVPSDSEPGLRVQDLVSGYLADVDWNEIADSWIEQVTEQTAV